MDIRSVSYTHLDVYKRQEEGHEHHHEHSHEEDHEHSHVHACDADSGDHTHEHHHHDHDHHEHHHVHEHRGMHEVMDILAEAELSDTARKLAVKIFTILGEAEALSLIHI